VQEGRSAKFEIGKPVLFFGVRTELTYLALRAAANRSVTRKTRCPGVLRSRVSLASRKACFYVCGLRSSDEAVVPAL
jgi:hypothetical protein